jgi:putative peptidoglycan lipid II flippase
MNLLNLSSLQKTTVAIFAAIIGLKVLGFLRDFLIANYFGINHNVDLFFFALLIPNILFNIFSLSFNLYFIPNYLHNKKEQGKEAAREYASISIYSLMTLLVIILIIYGWIVSPYIAGNNKSVILNSVDQGIFLQLSRFFVLFILINTLTSLFISLQQSEHQYLRSIFIQMLLPATTLIFIAIGHQFFYINSIVYGMLMGSFASCIILLLLCFRSNLINVFPKKFISPLNGLNFKGFQILLVIALIQNLVYSIDQYMASWTGEGKLSTLIFGLKIPDMISEVLGLGLGIIAFSHFSEWLLDKKVETIIRVTQRIIKYTVIFCLPACIYISLNAEPLIQMLFQRGAFSGNETVKVGSFLEIYAFSVCFFIPIVILTRLASAMNKNHLLLIVGISSTILKVILNLTLIKLLGLNGIAWATLITYIFSFALFIVLFRGINLVIFDQTFMKELLIIFVINLLLGSLLVAFCILLSNSSSYMRIFSNLGVLLILSLINYCLCQKYRLFSL